MLSPLPSLLSILFLGALATAQLAGPLSVSGRWIRDSTNKTVTYVGVNWPGAGETMIPEGLQYASVASIVGKVKELGMNVIRLTFAIQLVDEYYKNGEKDTPILQTFKTALGDANGTKVLEQVLAKNPSFKTETTRLEVFEAIIAECNTQGIYVHLDNHMSRAAWCCNTGDGNSWFGDRDFNVDNWRRGLVFMAKRFASHPNFVSFGLRNELREPANSATARATYNWQGWYNNMIPAAKDVHAANPNLIVFLSGLGFDTDLSPIPNGDPLRPGTQRFLLSDFEWKDKLALELHNYQNSATSCSSIRSGMFNAGYKAMQNSSVVNVMPVVLTEFGFQQDVQSYTGVYASCFREYMPSISGGWTVWVLAGSYYIRDGRQDYNEGWGLLNKNWTAWRSQEAIDKGLIPMVKNTLASVKT